MDLAAIKQAAGTAESLAVPAQSPDIELHIDGDYAAYYYSGNDDTSFGEAKRNALNAFNDVATLAGAGGQRVVHLTHALSCKGKRYEIATVKPYQGQRDSSRKPKNWQAMRDWLEGGVLPGFRVVQWKDREADDGVAAAAYYAWTCKRMPAILSRDKDFRMIPGRHINWTTLERVDLPVGAYDVRGGDNEVYGLKWFWLQMLHGDAADNIPGLPGIPAKAEGKFKACGPQAAAAMLSAMCPITSCITVCEAYRTYYKDEWADRLVEQAALLWLRTDKTADVGDFLKAVPANRRDFFTPAIQRLKRRTQ